MGVKVNHRPGRARLIRIGVTVLGAMIGMSLALGSQPTQAATLEVENLLGGVGDLESLPARVAGANAGDIITFDAALAGTITLDATLVIDKNLTITGIGTQAIEITKTTGAIISVSAGATLTLENVELKDATTKAVDLLAGAGGFEVDDVVFDGNTDAVAFDAVIGAIALTDIEVTGGTTGLTGDGASEITLTDSTFSGLTGAALDVSDPGVVVINGSVVDADGAATPLGGGIRIEDPTSVTVGTTSVTGQADIGLHIVGDSPNVVDEAVSITGGSFSNNTGGIRSTGTGTIGVTGTEVSNNAEPDPSTNTGFSLGLRIANHSAVTLDSVMGTGNANSAVRISTVDSVVATSLDLSGNSAGLGFESVSANATVTGGSFNDNDFTGLSFSRVSGVTTYDGVTATGNDNRGLTGFGTSASNVAGQTKLRIIGGSDLSNNGDLGGYLQNAGEIEIADSSFDENVGGGLVTTLAVSIDIDDADFDDNTAGTGSRDGFGASFEATVGAVTIGDSDFTGNVSEGIEFNRISFSPTTTSIDITGGTISANAIGVDLRWTGGLTTIDTVTFDGNGVGVDIDDSANVTIVDSTFSEHSSHAVDAEDSGVIRLERVTVDEGTSLVNIGSGVRSLRDAGVEVIDSSITNQATTALSITGDSAVTDPEPVTISDSTFDDNSGEGVSISGSNGPVQIVGGSTASSNTGSGVAVATVGSVALGALTADSNGLHGVSISSAGAVTATSVGASTNGRNGILVTSSASLLLTNAVSDSIDDNDESGIKASAMTGFVTLGGGTMSSNADEGISVQAFTDTQSAAHGPVTVTGPTIVDNNGSNGIELNFDRPNPLPPTPTGPALSITGATVTNNDQGLFAAGTGAVTITGSAFDTNELSPGIGDGASIIAAAGDVTVASSSFDGNAQVGLDVTRNGSNTTMKLQLDGTTADSNGAEGVRASVLGEVAMTNGSSASRNGDDGLSVSGTVPVRLTDSAFDENGVHGAALGSFSSAVTSVTIADSTFDGNTGNGVFASEHTGLATITGGSISANSGEPLVSFHGAGLFVGQSASTTGSLVVDDVDVRGNPIGVKTFGATAVTIRDADFTGHSGRAVEITQAGTDVTLTRVTVGKGSSLVPAGEGVLLQTVGSVDVDDLTVTEQTDAGLTVDGVTGTVDIVGSNTSDNLNTGIAVTSTGATVSVSSTVSDRNDRAGLAVQTTGSLDLDDVTAKNTRAVTLPFVAEATGIDASVSGDVSMSNVVADDNEGIGVSLSGLNFDTPGSVTVTGGSASGNDDFGLIVSGADGPTAVSGFVTSGNSSVGLSLSAVGDVTLGVGNVAVGNGAEGVRLSNVGALDVSGLTATDSARTGLRISGAQSTTISGSTFDRNGSSLGDDGVDLGDIAGDVTVTSSFFRSNQTDGMNLRSAAGAVRLDSSTFSSNTGDGASIGTNSTTVGNVSSTGSTFQDNGEFGLELEGAGNVSLTDFTGLGNYRDDGLAGEAAPRSGGAALEIRAAGTVTLVRPTVRLNGGIIPPNPSDPPGTVGQPGGPAVYLADVSAVSITGGAISDNHASGLLSIDTDDVAIDGTTFSTNDGLAAQLLQGGAIAIAGATVTNHSGNGITINDAGGAVAITGSTFADHGGTGLTITGAAAGLALVDAQFTDNQSGIRVFDLIGASSATDSTFTRNSFGLYGTDNGGLSVSGSTFVSNGTAILWQDATGDLSTASSTISKSEARPFDVANLVGNVSIESTTVTEGNQPALFDTLSGSITVDRSSFVANGTPATAGGPTRPGARNFEAADPFSGVFVAKAVAGGLEIVTSTFTDNEVTGPLIGAEGTDVTVRHSTIADNEAGTQVGSDGAVVVDHSIVLGRAERSSFDAVDVTATFSVLSSGTGIGGTTVEVLDALLLPIADNGNGTPSRAPTKESPAVSFGNPSIIGAPATDQTGGPRVRDVIEAGAVEFDPDRDDPVVAPPPPVPVPPALIESLPPERFADTRPSGATVDGDFEADGRVVPGGEYRVQIAGRGGVPADAEGVVINITAIGVDGVGFVTAHPCVTPRPLASSLNYTGGVNLGNEIVAGLSGSGEICLFSSQGAHLTVDVTGFVPKDSAVTPITPIRFMDTRPGAETFDDIGNNGEKLVGGTDTFLLIQSRGGIPSGLNGDDGIAAVIVNVTAIGAEGTGFVTVHPCLDPPPLASSLNYVAGVNRGNELIAPVDRGGRICLFTSATTHLTVDVVGYIPNDTDLNAVDPSRLLDTRPGQATVDGVGVGADKVAGGGSITVPVGGRGGVPENATAAIVNVTAIAPENVGFVTVHPCLDQVPNASSLNYVPGVNGGNEIVALLDDAGRLCLFTSATTHLAVDVVGYLE